MKMGERKNKARILVDEKGNIIEGKGGKIPAWLRTRTLSTHALGKNKIKENRVKYLFENPYYELNHTLETKEDWETYIDTPFEDPLSDEILYMRYIIHCAERGIKPATIAIEYFALVFSEILNGEDCEKALGLRRPGSGSQKHIVNYRKKDICRRIDKMTKEKGYKLKDAIAVVACGWPSSLEDENPEETIRSFYFEWNKYGPHRVIFTINKK
jgi:hypothetical protein